MAKQRATEHRESLFECSETSGVACAKVSEWPLGDVAGVSQPGRRFDFSCVGRWPYLGPAFAYT
jgi:hypothetical protein